MVKKGTILVADAEQSSVALVRAAAERTGLGVETAENGIEALERFRADRPAIVVVDRLLPILDGIQVTQKLRETIPGRVTPILLTGILLDSLRKDLRERMQWSDVLEKPFRLEDMLHALAPFLPADDEAVATGEAFLPQEEAIDLTQTPLARLLADVAGQKRTGELVWWDGRLVKSLFFEGGDLVGASSNGRRDRFAAWAARDPMLEPQLRASLGALAVPGPGAEGWAAYLSLRAGLPDATYRASASRWLVSMALELIDRSGGKAGFVDGARCAEPSGRIDGECLALLALRRAPGESFGALLPRSLTLLRRGSTPPRDEHLLTQVEQQLLSLADGRHTLGDLLALGRLIQQDVRPFLSGVIGLGLLEPMTHGADDTPIEVSPMPELPGAPVLPPSGRLRDTPLPKLLAGLSGFGLTGILQLRRGDVRKAVYFAAGRIVFASSNQAQDRLGNVLLAAGKISPEDHTRAIALQAAERKPRLGAILLRLGALTLKELHEGLTVQVRGILLEALRWEEGEFAFLAGSLPSDDMVSLDVSTPNLLLGLLRSLELDGHIVRALPADDAILERVWEPARMSALLRLEPDEVAVLKAMNDSRRVRDVFRNASVSKEGAARALFALLGVGVLRVGTAVPGESGAIEATVPATAFADELEDFRFEAAVARANPESAALVAENRALKLQLDELLAENRRLRGLLSTESTVCA